MRFWLHVLGYALIIACAFWGMVVFLHLLTGGTITLSEPNPWVALGEFLLCVALFAAGVAYLAAHVTRPPIH